MISCIIVVSIILVILIVIFIYYGNNKIDIEEFDYHTNLNINERLLVLSDLHAKKFGKNNYKLINEVKSLSPSIILIPGDLVDSHRDKLDAVMALLNELNKIAICIYISGNHERREKKEFYQNLLEMISKTNTIILNDKKFNYKGIDFIGIESKKKKETAKIVYETLKTDGFMIVLNHEPEYFKEFVGASIVVSGHAHGGQIRLFKKGLFSPGQGLFPKYTSGLYQEAGINLYVSRGLGGKDFRIRLFNRPHLILINLK